jgi:hypothetical protein
MIKKIPAIIAAVPHDNYLLTVTFDDAVTKTIDIRPFIRNGVSAKLKEEGYFKEVTVTNGYISWDNGFDFCPEFLYHYVP